MEPPYPPGGRPLWKWWRLTQTSLEPKADAQIKFTRAQASSPYAPSFDTKEPFEPDLTPLRPKSTIKSVRLHGSDPTTPGVSQVSTFRRTVWDPAIPGAEGKMSLAHEMCIYEHVFRSLSQLGEQWNAEDVHRSWQ